MVALGCIQFSFLDLYRSNEFAYALKVDLSCMNGILKVFLLPNKIYQILSKKKPHNNSNQEKLTKLHYREKMKKRTRLYNSNYLQKCPKTKLRGATKKNPQI